MFIWGGAFTAVLLKRAGYVIGLGSWESLHIFSVSVLWEPGAMVLKLLLPVSSWSQMGISYKSGEWSVIGSKRQVR